MNRCPFQTDKKKSCDAGDAASSVGNNEITVLMYAAGAVDFNSVRPKPPSLPGKPAASAPCAGSPLGPRTALYKINYVGRARQSPGGAKMAKNIHHP